MRRRIAILGSTGSIGRQSLEVLEDMPDVDVCALGAGSNAALLADQARACGATYVAIHSSDAADALRSAVGPEVDALAGPEALRELIRRSRPDAVISAVVGAAGLEPTLEAIRQGASVALANKETLVMAGQIVMPAARDAGVELLPVDSEHSAVLQCLRSGRRDEVRRVVLTASGGALRDWDDDAAAEAGVDDALNHPTWQMGRKITIDSASLMNKALEVIEAHWLFDLPAEQIDVVIHPQSIVHALVEFQDGSVIAQLAEPDMRLPIAYALHAEDRPDRPVPPLRLEEIGSLEFRAPGRLARSAIDLAYRVIRTGGASGAVLNGANEAAVEAFLDGRIRFGQIVPLCRQSLDEWDRIHKNPSAENFSADTTVQLQCLADADRWARQCVTRLLAGGDPIDRNERNTLQ